MAEQNKIHRRSLFAGLGLAVAAGVAAKLAPKAPVVQEAASEDSSSTNGYRLSEHVKKYYRTTTI